MLFIQVGKLGFEECVVDQDFVRLKGWVVAERKAVRFESKVARIGWVVEG